MTSRGSRHRRSSVGRMELIQESPDLTPVHSSSKNRHIGPLSTVHSVSIPRAKSDQLKRSKSFTTDSSRNRVLSVPAYAELSDLILQGKSNTDHATECNNKEAVPLNTAELSVVLKMRTLNKKVK